MIPMWQLLANIYWVVAFCLTISGLIRGWIRSASRLQHLLHSLVEAIIDPFGFPSSEYFRKPICIIAALFVASRTVNLHMTSISKCQARLLALGNKCRHSRPILSIINQSKTSNPRRRSSEGSNHASVVTEQLHLWDRSTGCPARPTHGSQFK